MREILRDGEPLEKSLQCLLLFGEKKPQTFKDFKRTLVEEVPQMIAEDAGVTELLFPIKLIRDIEEKDMDLLADLFDFFREVDQPQVFADLAHEYYTINCIVDAQKAETIMKELEKLVKIGIATAYVFFIGLFACFQQHLRSSINQAFEQKADQNLEDGGKWAQEIQKAIQNLLEAEISIHRAGGRTDERNSRMRYPGDALKKDVIKKVEQLKLEKPLKELEGYIETALREAQEQQDRQKEVVKESWPKRSIEKAPAVRQAYIGLRSLINEVTQSDRGGHSQAINYLDAWGLEMNQQTARHWWKNRRN
jgi:polyhydroxyalkanoate synthesis regulator protein